jgi:HlyD family secretion protein
MKEGQSMSRVILISILSALGFVLVGCGNGNSGVIEASGTIEGTDINVGSEVSGRVREVPVSEGALVPAGDTLVLIDDEEYQLQLLQAEANLASFESAYSLAAEGSRREDIVQAEAAYHTAETDYTRMKDLLAAQSVTQKQYDDAYARYVAAQQTYTKLKAGLRPAEITGARARRDGAAAQVALLKKRVRNCAIIAPSAGTVTLRAVEPGELVGVGTNVIRLTYLEKVKLTIYVNEKELGHIGLGQKADVSIDAFEKGRVFQGAVVYISPVAEFTPKNVQTKEERTKLVFAVKVEVQNPDGALKPGLPADARIAIASTEH